MKEIVKLSEADLNNAFNGSASAELVKEILEKEGVVKDNQINVDQFGQWFAYGLEDLIEANPISQDWQDAWRENYVWGTEIAESINNFVK